MLGIFLLGAMAAAGLWCLGCGVQFAFKLFFGLIGLLVGGLTIAIVGGVMLFAAGVAGLALLSTLGALMLPFAIPLLLIGGLVWALTRRPHTTAVAT
jgi:hypothetical protein